MVKEEILSILYQIADISYEIVYEAVAFEHTLPPHSEYVVEGDLIRKLAKALSNLEQEESKD